MPIAGKTKTLSPEEEAVAFRIASSSSIATIAFLLWDICITVDQEVELIWSQPFSFANVLYLIVRYLPIVLQISILPIGSTEPEGLTFSHRECLIWQLYQLVATMLLFMAVEYILLLRVDALYGGYRPIRWIIRCLYFVEVTCMIVGISVSAHGFLFDARCGVTDTPSTAVIFGVVTPVFQTLLFVLTFYKFAQAVKQGWGRTRLAGLLMRDGTWAFFVIEALLAANGILNFVTDYPYSSLMFCWLLSGFSFVGYRVILRLREIGIHPNGREDSTQDIEVCFASQPFSTNNFSRDLNSYELDEVRRNVDYET